MALVNQQKEQEMSIRKVFGASVTNIITTFSKPFGALIILANVSLAANTAFVTRMA